MSEYQLKCCNCEVAIMHILMLVSRLTLGGHRAWLYQKVKFLWISCRPIGRDIHKM